MLGVTAERQSASAASESNLDADRDAQDDARSLEQLQSFPESGHTAPSRPYSPRPPNGVTDDVNALSLSVKKATSYLGVSSVVAVLRIILMLDPNSKAFASSTNTKGCAAISRSASDEGRLRDDISPAQLPRDVSMWDEVPAINAYFKYVHPQIPLLEEGEFRDC